MLVARNRALMEGLLNPPPLLPPIGEHGGSLIPTLAVSKAQPNKSNPLAGWRLNLHPRLQAVAEDVLGRWAKSNSGFRCEDSLWGGRDAWGDVCPWRRVGELVSGGSWPNTNTHTHKRRHEHKHKTQDTHTERRLEGVHLQLEALTAARCGRKSTCRTH